jgi:phosphinothricin acetyltransferase
MILRPATADDIASIQPIYAHHVLHGLGSFEEAPPSAADMRVRFDGVLAQGLPYLAAEEGGEILGYGYCTLYHMRSGYRHALEDSVYVKEGAQRKGIGKAILAELILRCERLGYRQIIAVIGDSANVPSIAVHASLGFLRVGTLRSVGFKFSRWVDVVIMQRPLGSGDGTAP